MIKKIINILKKIFFKKKQEKNHDDDIYPLY